jgi:WhiB family redox-sensing transcriptional regulator
MTGNVRPGFGSPAAGALGWQGQAACRDADASLFFAPEVERVAARKRREAAARSICSGCPVRTACLDWRLESPDQSDGGIWAGADELERTRLRKNRLRAATREAAA